jgi:hypothetical protein
MRIHRLLPFLFAGALVACAGTVDAGDDGGGDDGPTECQPARSYAGFGGGMLETDRPVIAARADRLRLKPFATLATEYARALGLTSFDTAAYANTFGRPPARWFAEPAASANTVYGAFAMAYDACTQHTATDGQFAAAPDATSADAVCRDHARRAWNREASEPEVTACVDYTLNQTAAADPARKRWAYSCAAVLSASGFLAY